MSETGWVQVSPIEGGYIAETTVTLAYESGLGYVEMDILGRGKTPAQAVHQLEVTKRKTIEEFNEARRNRERVVTIGVVGPNGPGDSGTAA